MKSPWSVWASSSSPIPCEIWNYHDRSLASRVAIPTSDLLFSWEICWKWWKESTGSIVVEMQRSVSTVSFLGYVTEIWITIENAADCYSFETKKKRRWERMHRIRRCRCRMSSLCVWPAWSVGDTVEAMDPLPPFYAERIKFLAPPPPSSIWVSFDASPMYARVMSSTYPNVRPPGLEKVHHRRPNNNNQLWTKNTKTNWQNGVGTWRTDRRHVLPLHDGRYY